LMSRRVSTSHYLPSPPWKHRKAPNLFNRTICLICFRPFVFVFTWTIAILAWVLLQIFLSPKCLVILFPLVDK
jgi:hypothetical protein